MSVLKWWSKSHRDDTALNQFRTRVAMYRFHASSVAGSVQLRLDDKRERLKLYVLTSPKRKKVST
jgi:hypothetical protein